MRPGTPPLVETFAQPTIFSVTLPATGTSFFLITVPSFGGSTCAQGLDEYRFQVSIAVQGACCVPATTCFSTTLSDCTTQNGSWAANVACTPNDPCLSAPGKCCFPDQTCQAVPSTAVANSTVCTGAGGTYTAAGTCTPNTCMSALIACCQGATCTLLASTSCTGANTLATTATACNAIGNGTTPCCRSDYNHSGATTVQDIFDFLSGYFTQNSFADANDSLTVSVQDIFDYLAFYFTHMGPQCP